MNDLVVSRANAIGKAVAVRAAPVTGRMRTYISGSSLLSGRSDDTEFLPAHLEILETPPRRSASPRSGCSAARSRPPSSGAALPSSTSSPSPPAACRWRAARR
ncbi:hypothetical protein [Methylobacterium gregans]|uniref:hypothetical protein n=1 Tax=Methylobacterium gregans TaxID=374424 RepID=UPI00360E1B37